MHKTQSAMAMTCKTNRTLIATKKHPLGFELLFKMVFTVSAKPNGREPMNHNFKRVISFCFKAGTVQ